MRVVWVLSFLFASSVVYSQSNRVEDYHQLRHERQKALEALEGPARTDSQRIYKPSQTTEEELADSGLIQKKRHEFSFQANNMEKMLEAADKAKKEIEPSSVQEFRQGNSKSYFHKLSQALPCFKEFILNLYEARYKRDSRVVDCSTKGSEACADKTNTAYQGKVLTVTDEFYLCLERDPGQTGLVASQSD